MLNGSRLIMFNSEKINDIYVRKKNYEQHLKKLIAINSTAKNQKPDFMPYKIKDTKNKSFYYQLSQRQQDIQQNNQRILNRLISISSRKQSAAYSKRQVQDEIDPQLKEKMQIKRKMQFRQILSENEKIANRIMNQQATLNKAQQLQKFSQHQQFMNIAQKYTRKQKIKENIEVKETRIPVLKQKHQQLQKSMEYKNGEGRLGSHDSRYLHNQTMIENVNERSFIQGQRKNQLLLNSSMSSQQKKSKDQISPAEPLSSQNQLDDLSGAQNHQAKQAANQCEIKQKTDPSGNQGPKLVQSQESQSQHPQGASEAPQVNAESAKVLKEESQDHAPSQ